MKSKSCFRFRNFPAVFIFVLAAGVLLRLPPAQAQEYFVEYQVHVAATDSGDYSYSSGPVQSTTPLTTNPGATEGRASVGANCSASFGQLQSIAYCSVNNDFNNGTGVDANFNGAVVWFQDQLYITSATLPDSTPVNVQITCVYAGSSTPGTGIPAYDGTTSSAGVALDCPGSDLNGGVGTVYSTNQLTAIVATHVGPYPNAQGYNNFVFENTINSSGRAADDDGYPFVGAISNAITARIYVDVLTPGATYVASSGTVYPTLLSSPPTLSIQPATNGVVLFWPVSGTTYRLLQNTNLTTTNWTANTDATNVVNGTNQVTVSPASGNMFFRLINP